MLLAVAVARLSASGLVSWEAAKVGLWTVKGYNVGKCLVGDRSQIKGSSDLEP